jgi:hypothetical protein
MSLAFVNANRLGKTGQTTANESILTFVCNWDGGPEDLVP